MIDRTIAHYRITERLGGGGMGVVYRAEDTKLKRQVALKFLPPEMVADAGAKERFVREAQAASALDHPNICTIYEIGETDDGELFIAMACYDGETLKKKIARGPLRIDEAVDVARQIADGLAKAHAAGIVHRDVKPANVFVAGRWVKILDFGLAKTADAGQLTQTGSSVGTPAYMSPEQTRGEQVDHRTDLWSLGVVLYEMLTGQRPFNGPNVPAIIHAILASAPRPLRKCRPEVPPELDRVVARLLHKEPGQRLSSCRELLADLEPLLGGSSPSARLGEEEKTATLLAASPAETVPPLSGKTPQPAASVAVLPFVNLSADPENEYFSDGLAEDVILALSRISELRVPARSSSFSFRGRDLDGRAVGRELGVQAVLEGSVRRAGNRLRVSVELIDVAGGDHLWTERFDRTMEDVFALQDEISQAVVEQLKVELLGTSPGGRPPTTNVEAYDLYLKGRHFSNQRTREALQRAVGFFEQAIDRDPTFALAYAGLADTFLVQAVFQFRPVVEFLPKALTNASKAVELDESLAEGHSSLALARMFGAWELEDAEQGFRRAVALNPRFAYPQAVRALALAGLGRYEEAVPLLQRALELEPVAAHIQNIRLATHLLGRRFDVLTAAVHDALDLLPGHLLALMFGALTFPHQGQLTEAWRMHAKLEESAPRLPYVRYVRGYLHAFEGARQEARAIVDELMAEFERHYYSPSYIAAILAALGDEAGAKTWARKVLSVPDPNAVQLLLPAFDALHEDAEFLDILREIGFSPAST